MKVSTIIFLAAIVNIGLSQYCNNITKKDLERVISMKLCNSSVTIVDYHLVCLASSNLRDKYTSASAVANYTCIDGNQCSDDSDANDDSECHVCPENPAHSVVRQISAKCDVNDTWHAYILTEERELTITCPKADFSTPLRRNCSSCLPHGSSLGTNLYSSLYHDTTNCLGKQ